LLLVLFIVLAALCYASLSAAAKLSTAAYGFVVAFQILQSAIQVRKILIQEFQRTGNFSEGIRKLTRLIILVIVIMIIANAAIIIGAISDIQTAQTSLVLPNVQVPLQVSRLLGDISGIIAVGALLMGAWNRKPSENNRSVDRTKNNSKEKGKPMGRIERINTKDFCVPHSSGSNKGSQGEVTGIRLDDIESTTKMTSSDDETGKLGSDLSPRPERQVSLASSPENEDMTTTRATETGGKLPSDLSLRLEREFSLGSTSNQDEDVNPSSEAEDIVSPAVDGLQKPQVENQVVAECQISESFKMAVKQESESNE